MSALARFFARVTPSLAHKPGTAAITKAHAKLVRASGGRLGGRLLGIPVLVLRTTGRKSGRPRDAPMFFIRDEGSFVVVASNGASRRPPAWWLNLQADPSAVVVRGRHEVPVRARPATAAERERYWPQLSEMYVGYDHYDRIATRELPVVVLEPA